VREKRIILEHHADAALVRGDIVDALAVEPDLAKGRGFEAREHHQTRRLSRTRRPEHREKLTARNVEVEIFDDECLAIIAFLHVVKADVTRTSHSVSSFQHCGHAPSVARPIENRAARFLALSFTILFFPATPEFDFLHRNVTRAP